MFGFKQHVLDLIDKFKRVKPISVSVQTPEQPLQEVVTEQQEFSLTPEPEPAVDYSQLSWVDYLKAKFGIDYYAKYGSPNRYPSNMARRSELIWAYLKEGKEIQYRDSAFMKFKEKFSIDPEEFHILYDVVDLSEEAVINIGYPNELKVGIVKPSYEEEIKRIGQETDLRLGTSNTNIIAYVGNVEKQLKEALARIAHLEKLV